jgi:ATP adenylyltransferase
MLLGLSEPLPRLVESKFQVAKATHSLIFSPTELAIVQTTAGIPVSKCLPCPLPPYISLTSPKFQIRYCPSLAKKRTAQKDDMPREKKDPFDNPSPDLWIADIQATDPTHLLVLNKFPVIANHFILATKTSQPQTHLLEEVDLDATYSCLQAWEQQHSIEKPQRLFAFFNSGHHSGASQPHRHVQFLPVENMSDAGSSAGWNLLIDTMATTLDPPRTGKLANLLWPL